MARKQMKKAKQIPLEWSIEDDLRKINFDNPNDANRRIEVLVVDGENSIKATLPAGQAKQHLPASALYHEVPQSHLILKILLSMFPTSIPFPIGSWFVITGNIVYALAFYIIAIILGVGMWFLLSWFFSAKYKPHFIVRKNGADIPYFVDRHDEWQEFFEGAAETVLEVAQANPDNEGYKEMIAKQMLAHPEEESFEPAYAPWFFGQLERWEDVEDFYTVEKTSSPNMPYFIMMGVSLGAVVITALILGG